MTTGEPKGNIPSLAFFSGCIRVADGNTKERSSQWWETIVWAAMAIHFSNILSCERDLVPLPLTAIPISTEHTKPVAVGQAWAAELLITP